MREFQNGSNYLSIISLKKLEEEKQNDAWNPKKQKWTKPADQIGYKALRVQGM